MAKELDTPFDNWVLHSALSEGVLSGLGLSLHLITAVAEGQPRSPCGFGPGDHKSPNVCQHLLSSLLSVPQPPFDSSLLTSLSATLSTLSPCSGHTNWKGFKSSSLTLSVKDSCFYNFQDPLSPAELESWARLSCVLTVASVNLLTADISYCQSYIEVLPI